MTNNKTEEEKKEEEMWRIALIALIALVLVIILIFYLSNSARNKVFKPRVARPNAQGVPKIRRNPLRPRPMVQRPRLNYGY